MEKQTICELEINRRRAGTVSLPMRTWIQLREESAKTGVPVSRLVARALDEAKGRDLDVKGEQR